MAASPSPSTRTSTCVCTVVFNYLTCLCDFRTRRCTIVEGALSELHFVCCHVLGVGAHLMI
jgi:hypothetical protein